MLDKHSSRAKIPPNSGIFARPAQRLVATGFMTPIPPPVPESVSSEPCKHPRVQIVSRDEENEYVECVECGEVFEASEFKDMAREEAGYES